MKKAYNLMKYYNSENMPYNIWQSLHGTFAPYWENVIRFYSVGVESYEEEPLLKEVDEWFMKNGSSEGEDVLIYVDFH